MVGFRFSDACHHVLMEDLNNFCYPQRKNKKFGTTWVFYQALLEMDPVLPPPRITGSKGCTCALINGRWCFAFSGGSTRKEGRCLFPLLISSRSKMDGCLFSHEEPWLSFVSVEFRASLGRPERELIMAHSYPGWEWTKTWFRAAS